MENALTVSITPLQALLALGMQIWIVVWPIIIIRKLNRMEALLQEQSSSGQES